MDLKPVIAVIRRLERHEVLASIFAVFALFCPGVLTLLVLSPAATLMITTPKLLLLSASVSAPFVALNTVAFNLGLLQAVSARELTTFEKNKTLLFSLLQGCIATVVLFGCVLIACFLFHSGSRTFLLELLAMQAVFAYSEYSVGSDSDLPERVHPSTPSDQPDQRKSVHEKED